VEEVDKNTGGSLFLIPASFFPQGNCSMWNIRPSALDDIKRLPEACLINTTFLKEHR